jgi:hypothetical protein
VRRLVAAWLVLTALASIGLLGARFLAPGWFELELDVYVLVVGGIALSEVVIFAREAYPREDVPAIAAALKREPFEPRRPAGLERFERELTLATTSAFDLHARLRPTLREIAAMRLVARGQRLDEHGEAVLGEELWELVRPDRPPPTDRHLPGIPPEELRHAIERLQAL